jgi:DNA-binding NarL/FixJ family response regulator
MTPLYDIARDAAERFNMPVAVLFVPSRESKYMRVKTAFCQLAVRAGYTRKEIADLLGLDHSTVTHHVNKKEYVI